MLSKAELYDIIHSALTEVSLVELPEGAFAPSLPLLGKGGVLDSLSCMLVLVSIDKQLGERAGSDVEVVGGHNFLQSSAPFRTVETLADYIAESLQKGAAS